ncbi:MAG: hypothetical protein WCW29_04465 [Candidatus Paceibacterota bacterium]|jgi:hypothetical protein
MNETTYRSRKILSPLQPEVRPIRNVIDVRNEKHPAHDEIRKLCGTRYNFEVSFEEDTQTLQHFRHIPGLIAILCTLKRDGQVISFGRSCAVFSRMNKYLERTISTAINGSFLSATNNATKVFEALRISEGDEQMTLRFKEEGGSSFYQESEPSSEKQKSYLRQLISKNVDDEDERSKLELKIDEMSKNDASEMIKNLLNK